MPHHSDAGARKTAAGTAGRGTAKTPTPVAAEAGAAGNGTTKIPTPVDADGLRRLAAELAAGNFPRHIAALPVKDKIKRAFTLFEVCNALQPLGLFPLLPKGLQGAFKGMVYKERLALSKILTTNIWWGFFFGPFYYMAAGMWKKGLILLAGLLLIGFAVGTVWYDLLQLPNSRPLYMGLSVGFGWLIGIMAVYDLYRHKVKKEDFWW